MASVSNWRQPIQPVKLQCQDFGYETPVKCSHCFYGFLLYYIFLNSKGENHNHCFMDFDSLWMICLVLLKNNLINNEASNIRIETASAQPAVLPQQDGKGLKWVERCQVSHSPVLCWMDKSRKSIGREKEEVGSVRPRSTLWQFCLKTYKLSFIYKLEPSRHKRRMSPYFSCNKSAILQFCAKWTSQERVLGSRLHLST